jgi:hypothetical protein
MAEHKKSFLLYADLIHTVKHLSDSDKGELFNHILEYVNDLNPETENQLVNLSFEPIKQQLKRDLIRWEGIRKKRSDAGKKSAEKRREQKGTKSTSVKSVEQKSTNPTVNDNVNVNVNVNDNVINKIYSKEVYDCFDDCLNHFPKHLQPDTAKKIDAWLDTIDKLHRIENIPFQWIDTITKKTREDDFWSKNFLSLTKLRKKNNDGIKYIIVFNEKIKSNGKSTGSLDAIRKF